MIRLGSTAARLKLKGIDGDLHKQWIMWFNSMVNEEPYPGLKPCRSLEETLDVFTDGRAGVAWPSSVRGLSCSLKWGNERNPRRVLQVSRETAPVFEHEIERFREQERGRKVRMTPGQHDPLMSGATHIIQWRLQQVATG